MKRAALYLRVSTNSQTTENQERELRAVAERAGWEIVEVYQDQGISGAKGRDKRPALDRLCKDATRRRFDIVMAWSVDRLGRSLQHLIAFLADIHALGIDVFLLQQGIDTTTPAGKAMFQMMGVFAEFERAMIRERVNAGLARTVAKGTKLGRPKLDAKTEAAIRADLANGGSIRKTAKAHKVAAATVMKVKTDMGLAAAAKAEDAG